MIEKNWRNKYNILVPQADSLGALAAIRSLGEHGYTVFAASEKKEALGCQSTFAHISTCCPNYDDRYVNWLRDYIDQHSINAIVPSEGFLLAIHDDYEEFQHLLPLSPQQSAIYLCLCKVDVFDAFLTGNESNVQKNIPKTLIVNSNEEVHQSISQWEFPLFIKGDAFYLKEAPSSGFVGFANTLEEVSEMVAQQLQYYEKVLIQECFQGEKVTVNLLNWQGSDIAESMVLANHQNPHTGGLMSLRKSWWHEGIYQDALARRHFLGWHGAAMFEYKWNSETDTFCFIEINSRYWGALNLDILAGIHFPCYQMDAFLEGLIPQKTIRLTKEIVVRNTLPADFGYALSRLKDKELTLSQKGYTFIEFFLLFLHPFIKSDLLYPNDRKLYFINLWAFIKDFTQACLRWLKK